MVADLEVLCPPHTIVEVKLERGTLGLQTPWIHYAVVQIV
jgi:hypothetical protein